jgi:hypothetical protein
VITSYRKSPPPEKGGPGPIAVHPPPILPLGPADASSGPRQAAVRWINAVERGDYRDALRLTRELRRRWRIVVHLADPVKGGR